MMTSGKIGGVFWTVSDHGVSYEPVLSFGELELAVLHGRSWGAKDERHGVLMAMDAEMEDDNEDRVMETVEFVWSEAGLLSAIETVRERLGEIENPDVVEAARDLWKALLLANHYSFAKAG